MVVARRAFLDGQAGMTYGYLQAIYEYMIVVKTRELERQLEAEPAPDAGWRRDGSGPPLGGRSVVCGLSDRSSKKAERVRARDDCADQKPCYN